MKSNNPKHKSCCSDKLTGAEDQRKTHFSASRAKYKHSLSRAAGSDYARKSIGMAAEKTKCSDSITTNYDFIILGFSGAGKGTQAELLAHEFDMDVIDGGDYLRQLAASNTPLGKSLLTRMKRGHLAPTNIVRKWLKNQILLKRGKGLIISGQPRMINEAKLVLRWFGENKNKRNLRVLFLRVSEEEIIRRLEKRYVCQKCGKSYIIDNFTGTEKCDHCGGLIVKRLEDTPLGIKNRLKYFREEVSKTLVFFKEHGLLIEVNGEQNVEKVHRDILDNIRKMNGCH